MSTITRLYLTTCSAASGGVPGLLTKSSAYAGETPVTADSSVIPVSGVAGSVPEPTSVTLCIHVGYCDPNTTASLGLYVGPTGALVPVHIEHITGGISASADEVVRIPWYDMADAQFGVATMLATLKLVGFHGTPVTGISYEAWLEF